jgi:aminopeptidase N
VLSYLSAIDDEQGIELCQQQFNRATNMTDTFSALSCLTENVDYRDEALARFYQQWSGDALVMDKWFALQARSQADDTLERVKALLDHEAFSISNPNKVRSLVGVFASANPRHFHRVDGKGYELVRDIILELDPVNPQVAARLLQAFTRWKRYTEDRQAAMKATLQRIQKQDGLSNDCYEIVSRCLSA